MFKILINSKILWIILILISSIFIYGLLMFIINRVANVKISNKATIRKKKTVISLMKNIIKYIVAIIDILIILNMYGINTTSILAGLGLIGLVIGLAFQDILKDLLAGIFIIFDDQYALGDNVLINGFRGEVISLGLKTTKIKSYSGEVKMVANRNIMEVINYSLNNTNLIIDIGVSYESDLVKIEHVFDIIIANIKKIENVTDSVELLGINELGTDSIVYQIRVECLAMQQFAVKRQANSIIKTEFDKANINIPYHQLEVHYAKKL